jgi:hypothetical protein
MPIDVDHQAIWNKIRRAEATLRKRKALGKQERRALKRAAGGPCKATTKLGRPCRRRATGNQLCMTHGGADAMTLWRRRDRSLMAARERQASGALDTAIAETCDALDRAIAQASGRARLSPEWKGLCATHNSEASELSPSLQTSGQVGDQLLEAPIETPE